MESSSSTTAARAQTRPRAATRHQQIDPSMERSRTRRASLPPRSSTPATTEPASPSFILGSTFETSFQGGLQSENRSSTGGATTARLWGTGSEAGVKVQEGFDVEPVDDAGGNKGGQYLGPFSGSGYGGSLGPFSPMQLFAPQQNSVLQQPQQQQQMAAVQQRQQQQPSGSILQSQQMGNYGGGLNWQNLGGNQQSFVQSQTLLQGLGFGSSEQGLAPSSSLGRHITGEENWIGRDGDGNPTSGLSLGGDSSDSEDSSKGDADRLHDRKKKLNKGRIPAKDQWMKYRGSEKREVKREEFRDSKEHLQAPARVRKKKHGHTKPREGNAASETGLLEDSLNNESSASSSESGSSSDYSDRDKKEVLNKKRKRAGQDADGNVTWTDESVKYLFETYDAIHQRLWEESNGHVKYQKKWTPILKAMQDRFGKHFSKKQCQSKYWSVRRECTDYRNMSAKAARSDPSWTPSIAGRELLKPKFYDVWFEVSGKKQAIATNSKSTKTTGVRDGVASILDPKLSGQSAPWKVVGKDGQPMKHKVKDCGSALKEMQRLMQVQLQASEKREEAMKFRAELMMDLLTQHMEHVEKRVSTLEEGRQPQLYLLERVNNKLEKVLEGFTALNENLSIVAFKFTQKQSSVG